MKFKYLLMSIVVVLVSTACQATSAPANITSEEEVECKAEVIYTRKLNPYSVLGNKVVGTYFLVSNNIGIKKLYSFHEKQTDGSDFFMEIPTRAALVYEIDNFKEPYVEFKQGIKIIEDNQITCIMDRKKHPEMEHVVSSALFKDEWYTFYVPKGSVIHLLPDVTSTETP